MLNELVLTLLTLMIIMIVTDDMNIIIIWQKAGSWQLHKGVHGKQVVICFILHWFQGTCRVYQKVLVPAMMRSLSEEPAGQAMTSKPLDQGDDMSMKVAMNRPRKVSSGMPGSPVPQHKTSVRLHSSPLLSTSVSVCLSVFSLCLSVSVSHSLFFFLSVCLSVCLMHMCSCLLGSSVELWLN